MENALLEQIINEVMKSLQSTNSNNMQSDDISKIVSKNISTKESKKITTEDYPLGKKRKELINTNSGKNIDDITIEAVLSGEVTSEDIKITPEVLIYQAEIAESFGRYQFGRNLRRAAELVIVPDARVLEIYNALRPYRSTKKELLQIADELENKYNATINAELIRESAEVYEKRGRLKD